MKMYFLIAMIFLSGCIDGRRPETLKKTDELNQKCKAECLPREADPITYIEFSGSWTLCTCKLNEGDK